MGLVAVADGTAKQAKIAEQNAKMAAWQAKLAAKLEAAKPAPAPIIVSEIPGLNASQIDTINWLARNVDDKNALVEHYTNFCKIPSGPMSRKTYEQQCVICGVDAIGDDEIFAGSWNGDFGMDHYHTNPDNRKEALSVTLIQKRAASLKTERPVERTEPEVTTSTKSDSTQCHYCGCPVSGGAGFFGEAVCDGCS